MLYESTQKEEEWNIEPKELTEQNESLPEDFPWMMHCHNNNIKAISSRNSERSSESADSNMKYMPAY